LIIPVPASYVGISQALKNKLQMAQSKLVRHGVLLQALELRQLEKGGSGIRVPVGFIKNTDPRTSIKQRELSGLGILNVENRVKQLRLNHVYKIFSDAFSSYLKINL
jgi:hypothetical protein